MDTWKVTLALLSHPLDEVLSNLMQKDSVTIRRTRSSIKSKWNIMDSLSRAGAVANNKFDLHLCENNVLQLYKSMRNLVM